VPFLVTLVPAVISLLATAIVRRAAIVRSMLDVPVARSSHSIPTPTGGGLAIVTAFYAGLILSGLGGQLSGTAQILLSAGLILAVLGLADDRLHLDYRWRISVHLGVALLAAISLGRFPLVQIAGVEFSPGLLSLPLVLIAVTWFTNLYNFMDGIDGLAASEGCFIGLAAAALLVGAGNEPLALTGLLLVGATAGFLYWNQAPASIFMGDTGSGFLGYIIAALALLSIYQGSMTIWSWILLPGVFIADASTTLLVRIWRRDTWHQAHRTHAYQHLAARIGHGKVVAAVMAINVMWLAPLAVLAEIRPEYGVYLTLFGIVPLFAVSHLLGAGRPAAATSEHPADGSSERDMKDRDRNQ
jgi:Fuc2NAc and GlcNAc transferase